MLQCVAVCVAARLCVTLRNYCWSVLLCSTLQCAACVVVCVAVRVAARSCITLRNCYCSVLQCVLRRVPHFYMCRIVRSTTRGNTLQHTATHFNTLQHTAAHCSTLLQTAARCSGSTLTMSRRAPASFSPVRCLIVKHCNTLQCPTHSKVLP